MTHIIIVVLPWFVSVFGGVVFWMCARNPYGWLTGVLQQAGYIPLAILTGQWGFIAHFTIYSGVFTRNFWVDMADRKAPEHHKTLCPKCRKAARTTVGV